MRRWKYVQFLLQQTSIGVIMLLMLPFWMRMIVYLPMVFLLAYWIKMVWLEIRQAVFFRMFPWQIGELSGAAKGMIFWQTLPPALIMAVASGLTLPFWWGIPVFVLLGAAGAYLGSRMMTSF